MGVLGGGAIGAMALPGTPLAGQPMDPGATVAAQASGANFTVTVTRREDMLQLTFEFWNLRLQSSARGPVLVPIDPNLTSRLVAVFGPQAIGEEVFTDPPLQPMAPPIQAELSGPTRLVFFVPPSVQLRYTLSDLLGWAQLLPALPTKWPTPPLLSATSIEAPWHLFLSPDTTGRWNHSAKPVTVARRTELWHTRLSVSHAEPPAALPALNAIWTPGYPILMPSDPFLMSVMPNDRADIVTNTRHAGPARAELFLLSALGASIRMHGEWPSPPTSLIDWKHRTAIGRESYVRTVRSGFAFPFRNRAVRISITDREVQLDETRDAAYAYLINRDYVFITQPTISYDGDPNEPFGGRQNPLRSVTFTTLATLPLDQTPSDMAVGSLPTTDAIWILDKSKAPVPFVAVATDREQRQVTMHVPLIWVDDQKVTDPTVVAEIINAYQNDTHDRPVTALHGQRLAMAEPDLNRPGATVHHVETLTLGAVASPSPSATTPNFYPTFRSADIHLPGAEQLAGSGLGSTQMQIFGYNGSNPATGYLANGFSSGNPEVYLQLAPGQTGLGLSFPPHLSGGTATPNMTISGIARDLGPVAGSPDNLAQGTFNPADFFGQQAAKLLGAISLADIIEPKSTGPGARGQAPAISTETIYDTTHTPVAVQTTMNWAPSVTGDGPGFFLPVTGQTALTIHVKIYAPIANPSQKTYDIHGQLTNFSLRLFGNAAPFVKVDFDQVDFTSATGAKTSIVPKVGSVEFLDQLSFINDVRSLLTSLGGLSIDIEPTFITASYSLAIPSVGIGIFGLKNLKLATALTIPFDGSPVRLRFGLSTREDPFLLSISLFGGGGFFGLTIGADKIEKLEISLEFGAAVSIDIGVASGGVSIMAGIYFSLQTDPNQVNLTGFLRADGSLSVLGIVTISVEFYLGLTYLTPGKAYGEATVTVSVSVFCFSQSVDMTMQKQIGGSGDPTFSQAISRHDWAAYCGAFA